MPRGGAFALATATGVRPGSCAFVAMLAFASLAFGSGHVATRRNSGTTQATLVEDDDGDGVPNAEDCAPLLSGVSTIPQAVGPTLRLDRTGGGTLRWVRAIQGHVSNVYRSLTLPAQSLNTTFDCLDAENPGTQGVDAETPPARGFYSYLVAARNACGDSAAGRDSGGN